MDNRSDIMTTNTTIDITAQKSEASESKLNFTLEIYEGPLDLLLALIAKNKINIYDIPISLIFEQYMEYIEKLAELDMEVAGEFLEMASRLMLIKSRMLLPKPESTEEAEEKLYKAIDKYLDK